MIYYIYDTYYMIFVIDDDIIDKNFYITNNFI